MTHPASPAALLAGRQRLVAALAAALVAVAAGPARGDGRAGTSTHVIIVAHNLSLDDGVQPLKFADDDGARYFELFSQLTPDVTLLSVLDPQTSRTHRRAARAARVPWLRSLQRAVARVKRRVARASQAGRRTSLVFVYVGHGNVGRDGEGYVNLQDVRLRRRDLFREVVEPVDADTVHLIIDACKSYFLVSRGPGDWRDDRSGRTYRDEARAFLGRSSLAAHPNVGAILSTSGDEEVHEWSALRSGVFSHQMRSALSGAADINGDGRVEYSEVGAFIAAANRRVTHQRARIRPLVAPPAAQRHAALYDLRAARRGPLLELGRAQQGRFSIEDDRGVRLVDLNKAPGQPLRLALAAGHTYFVRHGALEAVLPRGRRGTVELSSLERGPARSDPRGALDLAYRNDLFAVSLTRSFYDGYLAVTDLPGVRFEQLTAGGAAASWAPTSPPRGLALELAYGISPVVLDVLDGVQHTAGAALRVPLSPRFHLLAQAELGLSAHDVEVRQYSLVRGAILAGAGMTWRPARWLDIAVEVAAGYQVLGQTGEHNTDWTGAKLGTQLVGTLRPWRQLPRWGITVRGGLYGHLVTAVREAPDGTQSAREMVYALPEGGVGLSYTF